MAHAKQERYSSTVLAIARKELVTIDQVIFNEDYEGEPKAGAVKIPTRNTEVVVGDYNTVTGLAPAGGTTTYTTITIGNDKAVNEIIDGYEAAAVPDNLAAQRVDSAGYSMGLTLDDDAIATLEAGGTTSSNTTQSTATTAYANFLTENTALKKADIPMSGRWAIISPDFAQFLKQDEDAKLQSDMAFQQYVMQGYIGSLDGVPVFESNNLDANTEFIIGNRMWAQRIMEWTVPVDIKDLTNEFIGSSAVQGRYVYEHAITKATAVRVKTFA